MKKSNLTIVDAIVAVLPGLFVGFLAGLVGLGGAEERMPFLLYGLYIPLYEMLPANLLISLVTSGVNFWLRARVGLLTSDSLLISIAMITGSLPGAYLGALWSHRISERKLKAVIAGVLTIVLLKVAWDSISGAATSTFALPLELALPAAVVSALLVGVVAGAIGVAGGEYRIPILIYVFGMPIKIAGTVSQLVSIPTMLVALFKHIGYGRPSRRSLILATLMGGSSVVGVVLSTTVLINTAEEIIRLVFAAILFYTIARIVRELHGKENSILR